MTSKNKQDRIVREALLAAGDVVYEWDLITDKIEWVGPVFEFFGTDMVEPYSAGEQYHGRINPEDLPFRLKLLSDHYLDRDAFDCEYRVRRADGRMSVASRQTSRLVFGRFRHGDACAGHVLAILMQDYLLDLAVLSQNLRDDAAQRGLVINREFTFPARRKSQKSG